MRRAVRAIVMKDDHLLVMKRNKFGQEFYALVGGGIDLGETAEQALAREVAEESGIRIANPRLVIEEDAGDMFGMQYIYLCDYAGGEPVLHESSEEAKINALGRNLYLPMWLPLADLPKVTFLPKELQRLLVENLPGGFPDEPLRLTIPA